MKVWIKGQNSAVDLTQKNYVAAGGQGTVYSKGSTAYKVYHNPKDMLPVGKIQELQGISDPHIIRPTNVLVDKDGIPIGYTTDFIDDAWTLCQLFPRVFRERNSLTPDMMQELVKKLRDSIDHVHQAKVLVVDLNEMNFLIDKSFHDIFSIDTDSYQTPHYPATAIMDSIRDWSVKGHDWTENTDWYSFAILSFQMFCGIHPFKGRYKGSKQEFKIKLPTDDPNDAFAVTRRRMHAGISVLHPEVGVPDAAYPLDVIPKGYKAWYEAVFAQGKRVPPPVDFGAMMVLTAPTVAVRATAKLDIAEMGTFQGTINGIWSDGTHLVVTTEQGVWLDYQRVSASPKIISGVGFSPRTGRAVLADGGMPIPTLTNLTDRAAIPFGLKAREVASGDGRIYIRAEEKVHEVILTDAGSQIIASTKEIAQTTPHASRLFSGVIVQKLLGSTFISLLIKTGSSQQILVKELDPYRIIDARFEHGVLMAIGEQKGVYDRLVLRFDEAGVYDIRKVDNVTNNGLNFTVLDSGVCVCIDENEQLELFSNRPVSQGLKVVDDPILGGDMLLSHQGGTLLFGRGSKLYKMKMR